MKFLRPNVDSLRSKVLEDALLHNTTRDAFIADLNRASDQDSLSTLEANLKILATEDPTMLEIKQRVRIISPRKEPVLILGDTGTGKELVAKAIHGPRGDDDYPFVAENCGAIPESLAPSIFFGYIKGAFTGALEDKQGKLVAAGHGTIFLDEIGAMSSYMQTLLLRAIQENEVYPVGSCKPLKINCRFIAATSRDIVELVNKGHFLPDLYYRLNTFTIRLPKFIERQSDIDVIAKSLGYNKGIDPAYYPQIYAGGVRAIQTYIVRMQTYGSWHE